MVQQGVWQSSQQREARAGRYQYQDSSRSISDTGEWVLQTQSQTPVHKTISVPLRLFILRTAVHWASRQSLPSSAPEGHIRSWGWPYLYVAVILFGNEGDLHREEVIGLPGYAELQAATLVFGIYHW